MLENATVTMPYKELKELLDRTEKQGKKIMNYEDSLEAFDNDPYKQTLDKISDLVEAASKCTKADEKQYFIYQIMIEYCRVFDLPTSEMTEGIPEGIKPKE